MKKVHAFFYRTETGAEPVREWLKTLGKPDSVIIGSDIKTVEYGWPIGMPVCRPLGGGLYEVRSCLPGGRTARVLFCIEGECMILLHGFIKKTQKLSQQDRNLAFARKRKLESNDE